MDLTLVPFGYLDSEDRLVDVHQVPSGKLCGCICPSCKAPLIARKGTKKVWHFAHDSNSEIFNNLEKCTYSFFVSARMMARQLIGNKLVVTLPRYEVHLSEENPSSSRSVHISELVTKSRQVQLSDVVLDSEIKGHRFDILGYIEGHALAFLFTHPGRTGSYELSRFEDSKFGFVEIALDSLKDEFRRFQTPNNSYGDILAKYISDNIKSKKWIYHPRQKLAEEKAKSKLEVALKEIKKTTIQSRRVSRGQKTLDDDFFIGLKNVKKSEQSKKKLQFICRLCNSQWVGMGEADATCRKCRSSLLVSRIDHESKK